HRFNPDKLLLDPYAKATSGTIRDAPELFGYDFADPTRRSRLDSAPVTGRSVVVDPTFDWGDDQPLKTRWRDTVVYEMHVKGFSKLNSALPEEVRGTYAGLGHPTSVAYLRDLGITAVELLPVNQFFSEPSLLARGLTNYWGYNPVSWFSPDGSYSASGDRGGQVREFKEMVKALHGAEIEVILDVVYNHTAETGPLGPTISFRGLDDRSFYKRVPPADEDGFDDTYWDVTGCGNTVDTWDPLALQLILDSLRYWVTEMHVDGFRFDLMPALTRTGTEIDFNAAIMIAIQQDPILREVKLIAEPWDTSMDGYLVGRMPPPWVEWNDKYRDTMRDFWRGATSGVRDVATRLAGSSDLYADDGRSAYSSVNFITCHDGFTLRDLVTYAEKHNEANGEDNRDGSDANRSQNFGVEGETDDARIVELRKRQAANMMITLCLSNGVPMISMGDERGRTQQGNNNAYCQDNEISWMSWSEEGSWHDLLAITRDVIRLRRDHPALRQRHWFEGSPTIAGGPKDLAWLHPKGREMRQRDWEDQSLKAVGMFVSGAPLRDPGPRGEQQIDSSFVVWLNASDAPLEITLPRNKWVENGEIILSPEDGLAVGTAVHAGDHLVISPHSCVVIECPPGT
ncbi:MAG: glycogen debranching protein GlgX, partial [Nocardioides sp.]|nr:glycogen debranching protein GlgX [Nocardioides sp.]